jgi:undecaprenyl-phosphate 4-deoxy-4-formamido-L-arabinose transferase
MLYPTIPLILYQYFIPYFISNWYDTGNALEDLLSAFSHLSIEGGYELILVNDGSTDGTGDRVALLISKMTIPVTFVDMAKNFGEHAAVLEGFRQAQGAYVINLDDDLQNPLSEALKLLDHIKKTGADVVYAYYDEKKHSPLRNSASWLTSLIAIWLLEKPYELYLCSFRVQRRELIERITSYHGPYPYIDGLILNHTNRFEKLLVRHQERTEGVSSYTSRKLIRLWLNMVFNFSIIPLRIVSMMGLSLASVGLLLLLEVLYENFFKHRVSPGWGSLMAVISIFSGGQLMMLGIIGEYIGRAYMTLSGKPQSSIRTVIKHLPPSA